MGKTKKDTKARAAGRPEQTEQKKAQRSKLVMDNIPVDLNEFDSSVSDSTKESM